VSAILHFLRGEAKLTLGDDILKTLVIMLVLLLK
jgi:hypothetical protein